MSHCLRLTRAWLLVGLMLCPALAFPQFEGSPAPEWRWRQILSVPRIGSRLRTVTVDPENPLRIFVGTEEGSLLRTLDGGVTWMEIDVRPFVLYDRSLGLNVPGLPALGATTENNFKVFVDPPWQTFTDRIPIPSVANPFPIRPDFFFAGFLASSPRPPVTLLWDVSRSRSRYTVPVKRVALCPGGKFGVIVATWRDVFGSTDGGDTFVRVFSNPGPVGIDNLVCNPDNPDEIAIATGIGLFVSQDGGLTFDQDFDAWPGQRATAVAYGPGPGSSGARLYSASGSEMFAGQFGTEGGMEYIYPSGGAETAPWRAIRWIATNAKGGVWLATEDGARFSPDYGKTWRTAARTLLSRQSVVQVEIGEDDSGGLRIVLMLNVQPTAKKGSRISSLHDTHVYSSDDGGQTWHPFFHGLTRRRNFQMDSVRSNSTHPAGWWMVTSGGVWTTYPAAQAEDYNAEAIAWADDRLDTTPNMAVVLDAALDNMDLSNEKIHGLADAHRSINWIPRFDLLFRWNDQSQLRASRRFDTQVRDPARQVVNRQGDLHESELFLFAQASWDIKDVLSPAEDLNWVRAALHEMRRQIAFATEDAWNERMNLLAEIKRLSDPFQIETLKARIESLEAMLDVWLGQTLKELYAQNSRRPR